MAYLYYILSAMSQKYTEALPPTEFNKYIDYTAQCVSTAKNGHPAQTWVSNFSPTIPAGTLSNPIIIYNPGTNRFLGNTETQLALTASPVRGTVAGMLKFESYDNATKWYFKHENNNRYSILMDDPSVADKTALSNRLFYDEENEKQVLIANWEPPTNRQSTTFCSWWTISPV